MPTDYRPDPQRDPLWDVACRWDDRARRAPILDPIVPGYLRRLQLVYRDLWYLGLD